MLWQLDSNIGNTDRRTTFPKFCFFDPCGISKWITVKIWICNEFFVLLCRCYESCFSTNVSAMQQIQRRIQNPVKHLRWRAILDVWKGSEYTTEIDWDSTDSIYWKTNKSRLMIKPKNTEKILFGFWFCYCTQLITVFTRIQIILNFGKTT